MLSSPSLSCHALYHECQRHVLLKQEFHRLLESSLSKQQTLEQQLLQLSWHVYVDMYSANSSSIWSVRLPLDPSSLSKSITLHTLFDKFGNRSKYFERFIEHLLQFPTIVAILLFSQTPYSDASFASSLSSSSSSSSSSSNGSNALSHKLSNISFGSANSEGSSLSTINIGQASLLFDHFTSLIPKTPVMIEFENLLASVFYGLYGNLNRPDHLILMCEKVLELEMLRQPDILWWHSSRNLFTKLFCLLVRHERFGMKTFLRRCIEPVIISLLQNEFKSQFTKDNTKQQQTNKSSPSEYQQNYGSQLIESIERYYFLIPHGLRILLYRLGITLKNMSGNEKHIVNYFLRRIILPIFINADSELILSEDIVITNANRKRLIVISKSIQKSNHPRLISLLTEAVQDNLTVQIPHREVSHVLVSSTLLLKLLHILNTSNIKLVQEFAANVEKLNAFKATPDIFDDELIHVKLGTVPLHDFAKSSTDASAEIVDIFGRIPEPLNFEGLQELCEYGIQRYNEIGDLARSLQLQQFASENSRSETSTLLIIQKALSCSNVFAQMQNLLANQKQQISYLTTQIQSLQSFHALSLNWIKILYGQDLLFNRESVLHDVHLFSFASSADRSMQIQRYVDDVFKSIHQEDISNRLFLKNLFISRIYDQILMSMDAMTLKENMFFTKRIDACRHLKIDNPKFAVLSRYQRHDWDIFAVELSKVNILKSPHAKVKCISHCFHNISKYLSLINPASGADDIFPILVYVVLKANILFLHTTLDFIANFTVLEGEDNYWYSQFLAAIQVLRKTII